MIIKSYKLFENKMWYKSIPQIISWLESKSNKHWIWLDVETTGLGGPKKQQLTQISAIVTKWDSSTNTFKEIDMFDEKIKLTDVTKNTNPDHKRILSFNHYGDGNYTYKEEQETLNSFFDFIDKYKHSLLIAQNAQFDMSMLGGRGHNNITNEVFDTKSLIQLYYLPLLQKLSETDPQYQEMIDFIGNSTRDNGLISSSMSKIGPVLKLDMSNYHDALTDCRITILMFQKIFDFIRDNKDINIEQYQIERIKTYR